MGGFGFAVDGRRRDKGEKKEKERKRKERKREGEEGRKQLKRKSTQLGGVVCWGGGGR